MKSNNHKRREFTASPDKPRQQPREHRQTDSLHFLAHGESIQDACTPVGVTCFACGKSSSREKEAHASVVPTARQAGKSGQSRQTQLSPGRR